MKKLIGIVLIATTTVSTAFALKCTTDYDPVCGINGKTYINECMLRSETRPDAPIDVAYAGPCKTSSDDLAACASQYEPVCGVDGKTYSNACVAQDQYNQKVAYDGQCVISTVIANIQQQIADDRGIVASKLTLNIIYATTDHIKGTISIESEELQGMFFAAKLGGKRQLIWQGEDAASCEVLEDFSFPSTMQQECLRASDPLPDTTTQQSIPQGCSLWYDGCNDCKVNPDGSINGCTKRYCVRQAPSKCLEYESTTDYQYLTISLMKRIEQAYELFLTKLSPSNTYYIVSSLRDKVYDLIAEKKSFLAVSRLTKETYEKTQFIIEVYQYLIDLIDQSQ